MPLEVWSDRIGYIFVQFNAALAEATTLLVITLRFMGLLQPLRSRPAEAIDLHILVVEVTQADLNEMGGYLLSDAALAQTVDTLQAFEAVAIALDIHRYRPRGAGRQALLAKYGLSNQLMLNYRAAQTGQRVSLQQVLTGQISPDRVRN